MLETLWGLSGPVLIALGGGAWLIVFLVLMRFFKKKPKSSAAGVSLALAAAAAGLFYGGGFGTGPASGPTTATRPAVEEAEGVLDVRVVGNSFQLEGKSYSYQEVKALIEERLQAGSASGVRFSFEEGFKAEALLQARELAAELGSRAVLENVPD